MNALRAMCVGLGLLALGTGVCADRGAGASHRGETTTALRCAITVEFTDARLADVVKFVETFTGVVVRPMWADERHAEGLDPEARVSVRIAEGTVIELIDDVLEQASDDFSEATWQVSERGELQIGPRARLNRYKEIVTYDINDLLFRIPDFTDAPELDIDAAMQQGGRAGGGGGGSIIEDTEDGEDPDLGTNEALSDELIRLIQTLVETEQWQENGGDGATVRFHEGVLVVRAPGYIHRQLGGG